MPFFHSPNSDTIVECIPTCHNKSNPPKYAPVLVKTHMEMKVSKALGKEEKMSD
jgi:isopenicillin N synthase-like dioxygenase